VLGQAIGALGAPAALETSGVTAREGMYP
jgi:hypothetical protein